MICEFIPRPGIAVGLEGSLSNHNTHARSAPAEAANSITHETEARATPRRFIIVTPLVGYALITGTLEILDAHPLQTPAGEEDFEPALTDGGLPCARVAE